MEGWLGELGIERHEGQVRPGWWLLDTAPGLGSSRVSLPQFPSLYPLWRPQGTIQAEASRVQAAPIGLGWGGGWGRSLCLYQKPNDIPNKSRTAILCFYSRVLRKYRWTDSREKQ